jgi:hypothetical protein
MKYFILDVQQYIDTPVFGKARIAHLFSFLCCVFVFVGLRRVLCLPNVASFSGLSILECALGFL